MSKSSNDGEVLARIEEGSVQGVTPDGEQVWSWAPDVGRASDLFEAERGGYFVLVEVLGYEKKVSTLYRLSNLGRQEWVADAKSSPDGRFVALDVREDELFANTWDGWRVRLNPETGKVLDKVFVK